MAINNSKIFKDNFLVWLINRKAPTNAPINSPGLRHRSMTESLELQVQETWEDGRSRYSSDDLFRVFLEVLFCLNLKGRMLRHLHIDRWTVASWRLHSIRSWNKPEQVRTSKLELLTSRLSRAGLQMWWYCTGACDCRPVHTVVYQWIRVCPAWQSQAAEALSITITQCVVLPNCSHKKRFHWKRSAKDSSRQTDLFLNLKSWTNFGEVRPETVTLCFG